MLVEAFGFAMAQLIHILRECCGPGETISSKRGDLPHAASRNPNDLRRSEAEADPETKDAVREYRTAVTLQNGELGSGVVGDPKPGNAKRGIQDDV